ncbi:MAG: gliding motility-associated C-terminal domain-containing protein [Prevotellaceae bacterium]|jgi:gliding motility-associated-like protein|nr:gliding motility-associated C-terminal domain-containing protein [Prevotellaceae bacterium]
MKKNITLRFLLAALLLGVAQTAWAAINPPDVTKQPSDGTSTKGATIRLFVNASSADGGYLTYQWYRSIQYATAQVDRSAVTGSPLQEGTRATLTTETLPNAGYYYYWVVVTNHKNGQVASTTSDTAEVKVVDRELLDHLTNGDFQTYASLPDYPAKNSEFQTWNRMPDWNTTHYYDANHTFAGKQLQLFGGYSSIPTSIPAGSTGVAPTNIWVELCNYAPSSIYQEIVAPAGKIYEWSLTHGRYGNTSENKDVMAVIIGPAINSPADYNTSLSNNGTSVQNRYESGVSWHASSQNFDGRNKYDENWTDDYPYGKDTESYFRDIVLALLRKLKNDDNYPANKVSDLKDYPGESFVQEFNGNNYYIYICSSTPTIDQGGVHYKGVYSLPEASNVNVFGFVSVHSQDGAFGNHLDDVVFQSGKPISADKEVSYTAAGLTTLTVEPEAGFVYGIVELDGSTPRRQASVKATYIKEGGTGQPDVKKDITPNSGGWYEYDAALAAGGTITFSGLTTGKTYRIVGIPKGAVNADLGVNERPENVLDEGYYFEERLVPAGGEDVWNVEVGVVNVKGGCSGGGGVDSLRGQVVVVNARADVEYALVDSVGGSVAVVAGCEWMPGRSGRVAFNHLRTGAVYYLVTRGTDYSTVDYATAALSGIVRVELPAWAEGTQRSHPLVAGGAEGSKLRIRMAYAGGVKAYAIDNSSCSSWTTHDKSKDKVKEEGDDYSVEFEVKITAKADTVARMGYVVVGTSAGGSSMTCFDTIYILQPGERCVDPKQDNSGKDFRMGFMENSPSGKSSLQLYATTNYKGAKVQVLDGEGNVLRKDVFLAQNAVVQVYDSNEKSPEELRREAGYSYAYQEVGRKSLWVTSDSAVTLYAYNAQETTSELTNIMPAAALGDEYFTVSHGGVSRPEEEILVVSVEDSTWVTITPSGRTYGRLNGTESREGGLSYTVFLDSAGSTYLIRGQQESEGFSLEDLSGTHVKGSKPVAVFSGSRCALVGSGEDCATSCDHLFEQMLPLRAWGSEYALVTTSLPSNLYRIVASQDSTEVEVTDNDGKVNTVELHQGESALYRLTEQRLPGGTTTKPGYAHIRVNGENASKKPVQVVLLSESYGCLGEEGNRKDDGVGDPFLAALGPVDRGIFEATFAPVKLWSKGGNSNNEKDKHYVTVIVKTEHKESTLAEWMSRGKPVDTLRGYQWVEMEGTGYSYFTAEVVQNRDNNYRLRNPYGFTAYAYGFGYYESYGYLIGAQLGSRQTAGAKTEALCFGDANHGLPVGQYQLSSPSEMETVGAKDYYWYESLEDWGEGKPVYTHEKIDSGLVIRTDRDTTYTYFVSRAGRCGIPYPQQYTIQVRPLPKIDVVKQSEKWGDDTVEVCLDAPYTGDYWARPEGGSYSYSGGTFEHGLAGVGYHKVKYTYEDSITTGCTNTKDMWVYVKTLDVGPFMRVLETNGDTMLCEGEQATLFVVGASGRTFKWDYSGDSIGSSDRYVVKPGANGYAAGGGVYSVHVSNTDGCKVDLQTKVTVKTPVKPELVSDVMSFCVGGSYRLCDTLKVALPPGQGKGYRWYADDLANANLIQGANEFEYKVQNENLAGIHKYILEVLDSIAGHPKGKACRAHDELMITVHDAAKKAVIQHDGSGQVAAYCAGDSLNLTAGADNGNGNTYEWYKDNNGQIVPMGKMGSTLYVKEGTYWVKSISEYGCESVLLSDSVVVEEKDVPHQPSISLGNSGDVCEGKGTVEVLAHKLPSEVGDISYRWYTYLGGNLYNPITADGSDSSYHAAVNGMYTALAQWKHVDVVNGVEKICNSSYGTPIEVLLHPIPRQPEVTGNNHICVGDSVTLVAKPGVNSTPVQEYRWLKGNDTLHGMVADTCRVKQRSGWTVYGVVAVTDKGCESEVKEYRVQVHAPIVKLAVEGSSRSDTIFPICYGQKVVLNPVVTDSSGSSVTVARYYWWLHSSPPPTNMLVDSSKSVYEVNDNLPMGQHGYTLRVKDVNGCESLVSDTVTVDVRQTLSRPPQIEDIEVCEGDSITLRATPHDASSWYYWYRGHESQEMAKKMGDSTYTLTAKAMVTDSGKYRVKMVNAQNCVVEGNGHVVVYSAPVAPEIILSSQDLCSGDSVWLSLDTKEQLDSGWKWFKKVGGNDNLVSSDADFYVKDSGHYTASYRNVPKDGGCWSKWSDAVEIKVHLLPGEPKLKTYLAGVADSVAVCGSDTISLLASSVAATESLYKWWYRFPSDNPTKFTELPLLKGARVLADATLSDAYFVARAYASYDRLGGGDKLECPSEKMSAPVRVVRNIVPPPPQISVVGAPTRCLGDTVTLTVSSIGNIVKFSWYKDNNPITGGTDTLRVSQLGSSSYTVEVLSAEGCTSPRSAPIEVSIKKPLASAGVEGDTAVCHGASITLSASSPNSDGIGDVYIWSRNDGVKDTISESRYKVWGSGNSLQVQQYSYTLVVKDRYGCQSEKTSPRAVTFLPLPNLTAVQIDSVCIGERALLKAKPGGAGSYRWFVLRNNYTWEDVNNNKFDYEVSDVKTSHAGTYKVEMTGSNNCVSALTGQLRVNSLPSDPEIEDVFGYICRGDSIRLNVALPMQGVSGYEWRLNGNLLNGEKKEYVVAKDSGEYSVRSVSEHGCRSQGAGKREVVVYKNPDVPLLTDTNVKICEGKTGSVGARGNATSYWWYRATPDGAGGYSYDPVFIVGRHYEGANFEVEAYGMNAGGVYAARAYVDNLMPSNTALRCTSNYSLVSEVKILPRPGQPSLTYLQRNGQLTDGRACDGEVVTLKVSPPAQGVIYQWLINGEKDNFPEVDSLQVRSVGMKRYSVEAVDTVNKCHSVTSNELPVSIYRRPEVKIAGNDAFLWSCGETIQLQTITSANDRSGATYKWYRNDTLIPGATDSYYEVKPNANLQQESMGEYYVYITNTDNGCESLNPSNSVEVAIRSLPPALKVEAPASECEGRSITLRVSPSGVEEYEWLFEPKGGGTLETLWKSSDTSFRIDGLGLQHDGRYRVRATNQWKCRSEAVVEVKVHALPARPTIEGSTTRHLCAGDTTVIQAYAYAEDSVSYRWYVNGSNEPLPGEESSRYTARTAGIYAMRGVSVRGCESEVNRVEVQVHQNPNKPVIMPNSDTIRMCADGQVEIRGISADAEQWQWHTVNAMGYYEPILIGGNSSSLLVRSNGRYAVSAWVEYGDVGWTLLCTSMSDLKVLELNKMLQPPIIRSNILSGEGERTSGCDGDSLKLTATLLSGNPPVARYRWFKDGVEQEAVTDSVYIATQMEEAHYSVEAITDKGCPSGQSSSKAVAIRPRPTVSIAVEGTEESCGEPITLRAEPQVHGTHYEWFEGGSFMDGATASPLYVVRSNADPTVGKTVECYLFVTDQYGCRSASPSNTITVNIRELPPNPVATIDSVRGVCENEDAIMRVSPSGADMYRWFKVNGHSFDMLTVTSDTVYVAVGVQVADAGQYAVEVANSYGCTSAKRGVVNLNVLNLPVVRIRETRACENWTAVETVNFAEPKGGFFSGLVGCTEDGRFVPKDVDSREVELTYTYQAPNKCVNSDTKIIELVPLPNKPVVTAAGPTEMCEDSILVEMTASVATLAEDADRYSYSYRWYKDDFLLHGEDGVSYEAFKVGDYTVRVCNQGLCWADSASDAVKVSVLPLPKAPVIAVQNPFKCPGETTMLFVESEEKGIIQWYQGNSRRMEKIPSEVASTYNTVEVGQYAVDFIGENGCRSALSNLVTVGEYVLPRPPEIVPSQQSLYAGVDYKLLVKNPQAGHEYEWYKNDLSTGMSGVEFPVIKLDGDDTGRYTVKVVDEHGCHVWSKDYPLVWDNASLLIPNVFTPNGDGVNDYFQILGLEDFEENKLDIINKQGRLIFSQKNYHNRWNGDGRPNDVFFYRLTLKRQDGSSFVRRGFVHLKN